MERGLDHLVVRQPGLHEHPGPGAPPADETGSAGEQPEGLLRSPVPGCQQLLIEVEERDCVGLDDAMKCCFGPDVHPCRTELFTGDVDDGLSRERFELLAALVTRQPEGS